MPHGAVRLAGRCLGAAAALGVPAGLAAQTTRTGMTVSAGVNAESNPYNLAGSDAAGVSADVTVQPRLQLRDSNTAVDLSGLAQLRQFFDRYGLEDNYAVNATGNSQLNARTSVYANGVFSYNEGGVSRLLNAIGSPLFGGFGGFGGTGGGELTSDTTSPADGTTVDLPVTALDGLPNTLTDVTLLGRRIRTTNYGLGGGINTQLGARSSLSAGVNLQALRFPGAQGNDFNSVTGDASYSRRLSEFTSVGLVGSLNRVDYLNTRVGDADTATALVSIERRLNERWRLSLGAGASFTDIRQFAGQPDVHLTSLNVRGSFCWTDPRQNLCLSGSRSPQPTASGNVRVADTVSLNYSRQLSARENLTLGGFYTHNGRGRGVAAVIPAADFIGASAGYTNQFRERVAAFVNANVSRLDDGTLGARTNYGASAGFQVRFGALR